MAYAPIALFVYRRLSHTKTTVESLLRNKEARDSTLYIFSDAAKAEKDSAAVNEVREYIHALSGFKAVHIVEQETNQGLAKSIIAGVTSVLREHGRVIVVEDDLLLSPYFLQYMNDGLNLYENAEQVASIHGYTYPVDIKLPETFFLRGTDCWGWATWSRAWRIFEPDTARLYRQITDAGLANEFDYNGYAGNIKMLHNQIAGKIDSWAIRWHASAFLANMVTLNPGISLVQNTGMDGGGTHGDATSVFSTELSQKPVVVEFKEPVADHAVYEALERYFKSRQPSLPEKLWTRLKRMLR